VRRSAATALIGGDLAWASNPRSAKLPRCFASNLITRSFLLTRTCGKFQHIQGAIWAIILREIYQRIHRLAGRAEKK